MKRLVKAISIALLLCGCLILIGTNEVWARRTPPKITPLRIEWFGHPQNYEGNMVIEPFYESAGVSAVKVYLARKSLSRKKVVWKTLLYTANYYLASLQWTDKSHQYVSASDERQQSYCVEVATGRRIKPPW